MILVFTPVTLEDKADIDSTKDPEGYLLTWIKPGFGITVVSNSILKSIVFSTLTALFAGLKLTTFGGAAKATWQNMAKRKAKK